MGLKIVYFVVILVLAPLAAFGSAMVCSNASLYSSAVRYDFGTAPRPGTKIGRTVIVYDGKTLLDHSTIAGLGGFSTLPYRVTLTGDIKTLEELGNSVHGSKIFRQTAVLTQIDTVNPSNKPKEIARGEVVCRANWAMVP